MDLEIVREQLIDRVRRRSESPEEAARTLARGFGIDVSILEPVVKDIRREGRRNMLLDSPSGVFPHGDADEARYGGWYSGPEDGDVFWPRLKAKLESGSLRDVVDEIDEASTKVVAHFAEPNIHNLTKRGLVVGYVQSGKTANYTAVMAKAADAGYRLFIVLAGMHNNLRRQTQVRLSKDLLDHSWASLTTEDEDFGNVLNGSAMLSAGTHTVAVVKKNQSRLRRLRDWLRDIPEDVRRRVPILLLDDEADQATPNSAVAREDQSRINELLRQIWAEIPTGTYVGYTATPFANVFMDPNDDEELYPADFIIDLPRPTAYFGAERLFGREPLDDADSPDPGLDMVRDVPDEDAETLRPPSDRARREEFDPDLPPSLETAVRWFVLATSVRWARGQQSAHSSMLVHTTHYVQPHFAMQQQVEALLTDLTQEWLSGEEGRFREIFLDEIDRVEEVATLPSPGWQEVRETVGEVLAAVRVVVDNGFSDDRLDYERTDEDGRQIPETVIAIGGGTLSRGLTLEGLVVSYFTRTSNTYDTLLQMGRWFGYRPGYEDLPRIWLQPSLAEDFRFLALVEEEIRQDMRHMERSRLTPRELGVRVRAHPGRLAIVARNKMQHADVVRLSYSGQRVQTFVFAEHDTEVLRRNLAVARDFIQKCRESTSMRPLGSTGRWIARGMTADRIIDLLEQYAFHEDQATLRPDHMVGWIKRAAPDRPWNVMVLGSQKPHVIDGKEMDAVDLGLGAPVNAVNRAPLTEPRAGRANIKALMSHNDWFADLDRSVVQELSADERRDPRDVRSRFADGHGLLIIYPVSKDSVPMGAGARVSSRRPMDAEEDLIGLGIIFPEVEREGLADEGTYFSVHPDWEVDAEDGEDVPEDREGYAQIDGSSGLQGRG